MVSPSCTRCTLEYPRLRFLPVLVGVVSDKFTGITWTNASPMPFTLYTPVVISRSAMSVTSPFVMMLLCTLATILSTPASEPSYRVPVSDLGWTGTHTGTCMRVRVGVRVHARTPFPAIPRIPLQGCQIPVQPCLDMYGHICPLP